MYKTCFDPIGVIAGRLVREDGQTLAEYGMLVGFIAVVVIAAAIVLGSSISSLFVPVVRLFV